MPTYDYKCDQAGCEFYAEEFFAIAERDRPVGTQCPACETGKVMRAVTSPHMQDVTHTEQQKLSHGIRNPKGAFKEKMQQIVSSRDNAGSLGMKQKRKLKDRYYIGL